MKTITRSQSVNNNKELEMLGSNVPQSSKKAEKMRRYRANLKSDPERLENARKKDRERKKAARAKLRQKIAMGNTKLQKKVRAQTRQHMQKYRKTLAAKLSNYDRKRKKKEEQRQKKETVKERTQIWRMRINLHRKKPNITSKTTARENSSSEEKQRSNHPSRWAVYRSTNKVKKALPKSPVKKAAVLKKLLQSPNTAKCLADEGVLLTEDAKSKISVADTMMQNITEQIDEVKPAGTQQERKQFAYNTLVQTALKSISRKYVKNRQNILRTLGVNWKNAKKFKKEANKDWWKQNPRKARKDRISEETKLRVRNFYLSPEVSRQVPNKKDVVLVKENNQKEYLQKHVMIATSADTYAQYKTEYPEDKIGFTSFKKLKPENVRRISETSRKSCLCKVCCNVALKVEALKTFVTKHKISVDTNKDKIVDVTLCNKEEGKEYNNKCLIRECKDCSVESLRNYLEIPLEKSAEDKLEITWNRWELLTVQKDEKNSKKITSCVAKSTSFDEFVTELEKDIKTYPSHRFRATWQHQQMAKCSQSLQTGEVMSVMDFAENYKCSFQNEPQDAFFDKNLVTIHPSMNYYRKVIDDQDVLVKHSITGISNDLKHDATFVKVFEEKSLNILKTSMQVEKLQQWSDGCAAQYKAKTAFAYLSEKDINISRNYFETSHGKNVCDGLGAVIKNSCYRAMLTGHIIGGAGDVHSHCKNTLEHSLRVNAKESTASIRQFIFIDKDEVAVCKNSGGN